MSLGTCQCPVPERCALVAAQAIMFVPAGASLVYIPAESPALFGGAPFDDSIRFARDTLITLRGLKRESLVRAHQDETHDDRQESLG